ncbi:MAG: hypothetical protein KC619_18155, partial [Myxococcales bacterium]|nr:hypothetical protein [Myxococcales bacterium]
VTALGEPLSDSLRLSGPSRTAAIVDTPAPQYPEVSSAPPDVPTRTSDAGRAPTSPAPEPGWSITDPSRVSHHDRPSPYAATTPAASPVVPIAPSPSPAEPPSVTPTPRPVTPLPATQPLLPTSTPGPMVYASAPPPPAPRSRRGLFVWLALLGLITFVAATAGAYVLVAALQSSGS